MNDMTNRLASAFAKPHPALVCFITAGDGDTAANLDALVEGGADVIELGMPFTDPMADGPAIQAANIRSLGAGTTTADVLAIASAFRQRHPHVPLVLMGYANPMVRRGPEWFAAAASEAGVDGVICVDIPPEEDEALGPALRAAGIASIRLATPTTGLGAQLIGELLLLRSSLLEHLLGLGPRLRKRTLVLLERVLGLLAGHLGGLDLLADLLLALAQPLEDQRPGHPRQHREHHEEHDPRRDHRRQALLDRGKDRALVAAGGLVGGEGDHGQRHRGGGGQMGGSEDAHGSAPEGQGAGRKPPWALRPAGTRSIAGTQPRIMMRKAVRTANRVAPSMNAAMINMLVPIVPPASG
ncbi:tryptophan synthase subunit alpha [Leptolyngbya sp. 15MV]|nr:tryptophan synthase subunit alpha [Leptolyngbya sp. 15MV]